MRKYEGNWLIACSSGPDSMALVSMCLEEGMNIAIAHVNYHHRDEADEEEQYLRSFADKHGLIIHVKDAEIAEGNFEAGARTARYDFFEALVKEYGYTGVMTAHQEDDLLETYVMQKEKNLVPEFYGIKDEILYHGVRVVRPLLSYTKQDLQDYCDANGIQYFIDQTNDSKEYTRNRVRLEIVKDMSRSERDPVLSEIRRENAELKERRCRINAWLDQSAPKVSFYRTLEEADRLTMLRKFLDPKNAYHLTLAHLKDIDHVILTQDDFMIDFAGKQLINKNDLLDLYEPVKPYSFTVNNLEELFAIQSERFKIVEGRPGVDSVTVTEQDFPLTIRNFKAGDAIEMRYGHKKVHRFFIDRHIPKYLRSSWPVVVNAENAVILVPGLGCARDHYSISTSFSVLQ